MVLLETDLPGPLNVTCPARKKDTCLGPLFSEPWVSYCYSPSRTLSSIEYNSSRGYIDRQYIIVLHILFFSVLSSPVSQENIISIFSS